MEQIRIAAVGAGGKTTGLRLLAGAMGHRATLFTTTTHIYPLLPPACRVCLTDPTPEELGEALSHPGVVCAGSAAPEGKLGILAPAALERGSACAQAVLYEGDGSRRLPLKLHRPGEPVLLPDTDRCLVLAGLSALGRPVEEVVHRYDRHERWKQQPRRPVGAEELLHCVLETVERTGLPPEKLRVLLNQTDALPDPGLAEDLVGELTARGLNARAGSLHRDSGFLLDWVMG